MAYSTTESNNTRTKAEFKAKREMAGYTQSDIASELGVGLKTVKRWETIGYRNPSDEAWELVDKAYDGIVKEIAWAVETYTALKEKNGADRPVEIAYFRTQEQLDAISPIPKNYLRANAEARVLACVLESLGMNYFFYSIEGELAEQVSAKGLRLIKESGSGTNGGQTAPKQKPLPHPVKVSGNPEN